MSMLCSLYRITPDQSARLLLHPEAVGELLGNASNPMPSGSLLSKLFGRPSRRLQSTARIFEVVDERDTFNLEQGWHILHYLFTGTSDEASFPGGFIMSGGTNMGPDLGYGPARFFTPIQTRSVLDFVSSLTFQSLDSVYEVSQMEAAQVYWKAIREPDGRQQQVEELWQLTQDMADFLRKSIESRCSILIQIY